MHREDFAAYMEDTFREKIQALREAGQQEYAHDPGNAFANFERSAQLLDLPREKVLVVFAQKHWDGIVSHLNGHRSQREPVQGRIDDMIVYLFLLRAMIDQEEVGSQQAPVTAKEGNLEIEGQKPGWQTLELRVPGLSTQEATDRAQAIMQAFGVGSSQDVPKEASDA